jgi:uncharacterized protein YndB with AHSA1/START domain
MQKPKLVYLTYIRTTPKKLWDAITKPEFTCQYWAGAKNVSDWKKGSKWEHVFENEPDPVWLTGKVLQIVPSKRLVLSWADPDRPADQSRVTFEIEPVADQVCLKVTHDQLKAGSKMFRGVSRGWPQVLSSMKSFLETGKGLNLFGRGK